MHAQNKVEKTNEYSDAIEQSTRLKNHLPAMLKKAAENPPSGLELLQILFLHVASTGTEAFNVIQPSNLKALFLREDAFGGWRLELAQKEFPEGCSGKFETPYPSGVPALPADREF
ncbi:hypothetical protein [Aliiroseovarius sp. 2305UL8-7]|uniref:hypothetical protein n=1 Tax=Aliiroseovarius conchicola TaxID=3121637 RepID=UPI003529072E